MYTLCQACRTVFHITAAELRAADGAVVCGACGVTFNALETLSETRPADPPPPPSPGTLAVGSEEAPSAADLARDEDEFLEELESLIGSDTEEAREPEIRLSHGRVEPPAEADLDDAAVIPIDDAFDDVFDDELDDVLDEGPGAALDQEPDEHLDDRIPDPDSVFRVDDLPVELDADHDEQPFVSDSGVEDGRADDHEEGYEDEPPEEAGEPHDAKLPAITTGDGADDADLHDLDDERSPEPAEETDREDQRVDTADLDALAGTVRRRRTWPKVLAGLLLALVLGGTWVHSQRGKLLRNSAVESLLAPVYGVLGIAAAPDWDPAAFRALQWEAVADVDRPGHLTVAVDFQNSAPFDQPYPIIRIVLEDRFGRRLGTHDLAPAEYRDGHSPGERLPAGARLRTTLMVPDPSARADGFRVDFCLEIATKGLVCGPQTFR